MDLCWVVNNWGECLFWMVICVCFIDYYCYIICWSCNSKISVLYEDV